MLHSRANNVSSSRTATLGCERRTTHHERKSERLGEYSARLTEGRAKLGSKDNSWEARKASRAEKESVVKR